ncbi:unnamed protein product [Urochloa humidicola]
MSSAEAKIDLVLSEMKTLQANQLKLTTTVESLHSKSDSTDKIAADLSEEVKNLTARIAALEAVTSASTQAPLREEEGRANGHCVEKFHQGADPRSSTSDPTLVKGENSLRQLKFDLDPSYTSDRKVESGRNSEHREFKLPKVDFPKFNGEHPRLWRENCEKYFSMYHVPVYLWVPYATLSFVDNATLWLQTYEAQHSVDSWPELCVAVERKFGVDLYQNYMRDFLSIRQTSNDCVPGCARVIALPRVSYTYTESTDDLVNS